ncbi:hypothetical protein [Mesorhizobium sp. M1406]|uniref:hypothetical protein n=1 Tax=Mesorhizobium sp. M1406 TaxID=2957099 RepID=UPI00333E1379
MKMWVHGPCQKLLVIRSTETAHLDEENYPLIGVPLTIIKGDKPRTIYPPIRLVDRMQSYINFACRRSGRCGASGRIIGRRRRSSSIFRETRSARHDLTAVFAEAFRGTGVTGTLHHLSHTFAMTMLVRLQRQALTTWQVRAAEINGELRNRLRAPFRHPELNVPPIFEAKTPLLRAA